VEQLLKQKAQHIPRKPEDSTERFFRKHDIDTQSQISEPGETEEDREKTRLLRSISGRGLFLSGGQMFKKKSLKELEEDRIAWREREEAKRQNEAEERRRKQEQLQQRNEQERMAFLHEQQPQEHSQQANNNEEEDRLQQEHEQQEQFRLQFQQQQLQIQKEQLEQQQREQQQREQQAELLRQQEIEEQRREAREQQKREEEERRRQMAEQQAQLEREELRREEERQQRERLRQQQEEQEEQDQQQHQQQQQQETREDERIREEQEEAARRRDQQRILEELAEEQVVKPTYETIPRSPETAPDVILDSLLSQPTPDPPTPRQNAEAEELIKKLGQLRDLLPYYKDKPVVQDIGQYLADFARVMAFLRATVYGYRSETNLSESFDYDSFTDAVSGSVKFILENLNFLTFDEDRAKILKASDAILQVAMVFIAQIKKNAASELPSLQAKWERLCRLLWEYTLAAATEKASVEETREQSRRKLTATILRIQTLSWKIWEIMAAPEFHQEPFLAILQELTSLLKAIHPIVGVEGTKQLVEATRTTLQIASAVIQGKGNDPGKRTLLEKYLVLTTRTLLKLRDAI